MRTISLINSEPGHEVSFRTTGVRAVRTEQVQRQLGWRAATRLTDQYLEMYSKFGV